MLLGALSPTGAQGVMLATPTGCHGRVSFDSPNHVVDFVSSPAASSCVLPGLIPDMFVFRSRRLGDGLHASTAAVSGGDCGLLRLSFGRCYGQLLWGGVGMGRGRVLLSWR
jgi:hypothetical protein